MILWDPPLAPLHIKPVVVAIYYVKFTQRNINVELIWSIDFCQLQLQIKNQQCMVLKIRIFFFNFEFWRVPLWIGLSPSFLYEGGFLKMTSFEWDIGACKGCHVPPFRIVHGSKLQFSGQIRQFKNNETF